MFVHDDSRRKLIEFGKGSFKVCKAIVAKDNCVLGNHWHANKTEVFLLLSGRAVSVTVGEATWADVEAPQEWIVPPGTYHEFLLEAGAVLIGTATEEFDPSDERHGTPKENSLALERVP